MNPSDLLAIKAGAEIMEAMPYVQTEIEGMIKTVQTRAYTAIRKGTMTPDVAIDLWMEANAYDQLLKKLTTRVTVAHSMADKHQQTINEGDD